MSLVNLPDDSVRAVCEFLRVESSYPEDLTYTINQTNILDLLDTCKRMRELKLSEVGIWCFMSGYAEQYSTDEAF
jgi:hypothetical protein